MTKFYILVAEAAETLTRIRGSKNKAITKFRITTSYVKESVLYDDVQDCFEK